MTCEIVSSSLPSHGTHGVVTTFPFCDANVAWERPLHRVHEHAVEVLHRAAQCCYLNRGVVESSPVLALHSSDVVSLKSNKM